MSHEIIQTALGHTAFVDDKTGNRSLHMQANSRVLTTLIGVITQTSPGVIQSLAGDTSLSLPAGSVPVNLSFYGAKNAGTTSGTISVGIDTTSTYFLNAANVANAPTGLGQQTPAGSNLFLALALAAPNGAHVLTGSYAESATSGSGGPWYIEIDYYLPVPT